MTTLSDYLSGLEAVEAKATNGEWKNVGVHVFNKRTRAIVACYPDATSARANAALIATARNNLPKLIAIVRAQDEALKLIRDYDRTIPDAGVRAHQIASATLARVGEIVNTI